MSERTKAIISAIVIVAVNVAALLNFDLDGDAMLNALMGLAAFVSWAWAIWKNHNFTDAAAEGQRVTDALKAVRKNTGEQLSAELAIELTRGRGEGSVQ